MFQYMTFTLNMLLFLGTFIETSMPVVDYYRGQGKVVDVSCG